MTVKSILCCPRRNSRNGFFFSLECPAHLSQLLCCSFLIGGRTDFFQRHPFTISRFLSTSDQPANQQCSCRGDRNIKRGASDGKGDENRSFFQY